MISYDWGKSYPMSGLLKDRPAAGSKGLTNSSTFLAMDENKKYIYSEENKTWYEVPAGGGGGGESDTIVFHVDEDTEVSDYTLPLISNNLLTEIYNAVITREKLVYVANADDSKRFVVTNAKADGIDTFIYLINEKDCVVEYKSTNNTNAEISITLLGAGQIIDAGSNQYIYDSYSLPAIDKDVLVSIYNNHKAANLQVIKWTLLGSETYLACVSADYIVGNYSIDVLVHNKYHCQYTWDNDTTGLVNPEVKADKEYDFISLSRLGNYLFEVTFDDIPEYKPLSTFAIGGCSAFVRDGKLYRTFDWSYDNTAEFLVRTKNFDGISMIIGMEDGALDFDKVGQTPYHVVDGVNTNGIRVSTHILYNDFEYVGSGKKNKSITQLPYYILDNIKDISNLSEDLTDYFANMSIPDALAAMGYLIQILVTDGTTTYVITPPETADGTYSVVNATTNPKLTNFKWVKDAIVEREDLQLRPTGVERWNEIDDLTILPDLRFTKAYENPIRLSEFIGAEGTTKYSTDEELEEIYNQAHALYPTRTRNGQFWQTVHAVIYGEKGIEHLFIQEDYDKDYIASIQTTDIIINDATKIPNAKAVYDYIASGKAGKTRYLDGVNINTILASGLYSCNQCTNRPTANNGVMIVLQNGAINNENTFQFYATFNANVVWYRQKYNGTWTAWKKLDNFNIIGYYKASEDKFYEKLEGGVYSKEIEKQLGNIYIDITDVNSPFSYICITKPNGLGYDIYLDAQRIKGRDVNVNHTYDLEWEDGYKNETWYPIMRGGDGAGKVADAYLKKIEKDEVNKEITISDDLGIETKFNYGGGDIGEVTYFEFNFTDGTTKNYKLINED